MNKMEKDLEKIRKNNRDREITYIELEDYDKSYLKSIEDGTGFVIDEKINYEYYFKKLNKEEIKEMIYLNSIYSYKYGISMNDEEKVIDKVYSCNCGQLTGIDNIDYVCPNCRTEVERMESKKVGWLILKEFKIIHPFILFILNKDTSPIEKKKKTKRKSSLKDKIISPTEEEVKKDEDIIDDDNQDDNGDETEEKVEEKEVEVKKNKKVKKEPKSDGKYTLLEALNERKLEYTWSDILDTSGIKLEEFITKYLRTKKDLLMKYRDIWYTNKILVISKNYRPIAVEDVEVVGNNQIDNYPLNTLYTNISSCIRDLNDKPYSNPKSWIDDQLKAICNYVANVGSTIFSEIGSDKKAHIRNDIYGKKYTFSGRLVLEPIVDNTIHEIDVCQIPIDFFRSIYANDIMSIGKSLKIRPITLKRILDIDTDITEEEKKIVVEKIFPLVKNAYIYNNREPDIYITSIIALRIHSLIDEMVVRIPVFLLPSIKGDHDGDVLSHIAWETPEMRERVFKTLGIKRAIIDTFEIKYNNDIGPNNNASVILYKGFNKPIKLRKVK